MIGTWTGARMTGRLAAGISSLAARLRGYSARLIRVHSLRARLNGTNIALLAAIAGALIGLLQWQFPKSTNELAPGSPSTSNTSSASNERASTQNRHSRYLKIDLLRAGDCVKDPDIRDTDKAWPGVSEVVPCETEHDGEVFYRGTLGKTDGKYPGYEVFNAQVRSSCEKEFQKYIGIAYRESSLDYTYVAPDVEQWNQGDRNILCAAYQPNDTLSWSVRRSHR
ncbi:hypothetical protein CP973_36680 [Streptomyces albofaciens JCM 4342]|uniref:septum formation family protein n=1 Tax=Streptomyces albofaciens TaxID=66866 RepID=UPI00123AE522|nr:septum formation family protein [Streptomyces albofaciens]KAA6214605.1 hypothetical protein CP973_36680 [Streptomyces albofaciens JCM 4342]